MIGWLDLVAALLMLVGCALTALSLGAALFGAGDPVRCVNSFIGGLVLMVGGAALAVLA